MHSEGVCERQVRNMSPLPVHLFASLKYVRVPYKILRLDVYQSVTTMGQQCERNCNILQLSIFFLLALDQFSFNISYSWDLSFLNTLFHDKSTWIHFVPHCNFIPLSFYETLHDKDPSGLIYVFFPKEVLHTRERSFKKR